MKLVWEWESGRKIIEGGGRRRKEEGGFSWYSLEVFWRHLGPVCIFC